ncbi:hypothetical protein LZ198_37635 [Myxococcus sp. K15C18031901]|uniref:hypothetical protein n=1 Tax=Myxococcus dinghuensis TaxID=2906761 RepID=UPI0020A76BFB|nr:hypothetical protein [Myxococcus dinghuensis]MCP3104601.1 hypothetical protein [Myxococcus dinghuensis]
MRLLDAVVVLSLSMTMGQGGERKPVTPIAVRVDNSMLRVLAGWEGAAPVWPRTVERPVAVVVLDDTATGPAAPFAVYGVDAGRSTLVFSMTGRTAEQLSAFIQRLPANAQVVIRNRRELRQLAVLMSGVGQALDNGGQTTINKPTGTPPTPPIGDERLAKVLRPQFSDMTEAIRVTLRVLAQP